MKIVRSCQLAVSLSTRTTSSLMQPAPTPLWRMQRRLIRLPLQTSTSSVAAKPHRWPTPRHLLHSSAQLLAILQRRQRIAMLESPGTERHGLARMLCKPIGAARDINWHKSEIIFWSVCPASVAFIILIACVIGHCCCKKQDQVQT